MKKSLFISFLSVLLLIAVFAVAESIDFEPAGFKIDVSEKEYTNIVTKYNIESHKEFLSENGFKEEELKYLFDNSGLLLRAYNLKDKRVFSVYAKKDSEAEQFFDINEQTSETRASYRRLHGKGGFKENEGYFYNYIEWKSFKKPLDRWLMLKFDFKKDGQKAYRGLQRRTIRNGYTITLELINLEGKGLTTGDANAMTRAFSHFRFEKIFDLPDLPVTFNEKTTAPSMTSTGSFTMTGKTAPNAKLRAAIISYTTNQNIVIETQAKKNGSYRIDVKLPSEDLYMMTLSIEKEGTLPLEKQYSITYGKGKLNSTIETFPPETLNRDSYTISGKTERGVQVVLNVNGIQQKKKVGDKKSFSFKIDTSREGEYNISLSLSKKGFETQTYTYKCKRSISADEKLNKLISEAISVDYTKLSRNIDKYDGKTLVYDGIVKDIVERGSEFLSVLSIDDEKNQLLLYSSQTKPEFSTGDTVRLYGELVGSSLYQQGEEKAKDYPKLQLKHFQSFQSAK